MPPTPPSQQTNGHSEPEKTSHLPPTSDDDIHDLICVGFGPASLAIAVALHDALDSPKDAANLKTNRPKVRFLERQNHFAWHAGMLLPGAKMQITFIKDLATLRNPRSEFTFLNYLFNQDRLVHFTNLSTFLPQRIEYEDYMRWCANHFTPNVSYSQDVSSITAGPVDPTTNKISHFTITSTNTLTNTPTTLRTRNVIIAAGGKPSLPAPFTPTSSPHPRILHSSQYATTLPTLFPAPTPPPTHIAVIGGGQSAAEIFHNLPQNFPPSTKISLLIRGAALKPSDDSPFVNEIFDPERVDQVWQLAPEIRQRRLLEDKSTNYGVVRPELLEEIYGDLYSQRVRGETRLQILNFREVVGVETGVKGGGVRLRVRDLARGFAAADEGDGGQRSDADADADAEEFMDVDAVVVASGYRRDAHEEMLRGVEGLKPLASGGDSGKEGRKAAKWEVQRDYRVKTRPGAVSEDAGIWLQGCNEGTHGLSDTLLSILATRGGEMVQSLLGATSKQHPKPSNGYATNGLHGHC
ncbi:hypothetical protein MBLNU230_g1993t1 [Neophaeotheca triangularis]